MKSCNTFDWQAEQKAMHLYFNVFDLIPIKKNQKEELHKVLIQIWEKMEKYITWTWVLFRA